MVLTSAGIFAVEFPATRSRANSKSSRPSWAERTRPRETDTYALPQMWGTADRDLQILRSGGVPGLFHKAMPFILNLYVGEDQIPKAIVVADTLWCQTCKPLPEPIPMPELA